MRTIRPISPYFLGYFFALAAALSVAGVGGCKARNAKEDAPTGGDAASASSLERVPATGADAVAPHPIARPKNATWELAILTRAAPGAIDKAIARDALRKAVGASPCGDKAACDAVRAFIADEEQLAVRVEKSAAWGIPKGEALAFAASTLSDAERAAIPSLTYAIVITARARATSDHLVARAASAVASGLATSLRGLVYDEALRRIETAAAFGARAIATPLGGPVYREDRIVIQIYREDDGSARLLTLGMRRFGAPDVEIEGASMSAGPALGALVNALAAKLVDGASEAPIAITLDDVARARDKPPAALRAGGAPSRAVLVDLRPAGHHQGDPDNTFLRIHPAEHDDDGGAAAYDALVAALFGARDAVIEGADDSAVTQASARAKLAFPAAVDRWRTEAPRGATLLVKLPFAIPAAPHEGDAGTEWMWLEVATIDATEVTGTLANDPAYIPGLKSGAAVRGKRADVFDYMLTLGDGGAEGGETTRILEGRRR